MIIDALFWLAMWYPKRRNEKWLIRNGELLETMAIPKSTVRR